MAEILSQEEVDSLLSGLSGGQAGKDPAPKPPEDGSRPYDITSQKRVIRGRMPGFDIVNEKYVRNVKNSISNLLRKPVEFSAEKMEVLRYGDFLNTLQMPANLNIFTLEPLEGYGLIVLEANLVFAFVNAMFGGAQGFHTKVEGREFTQIELKIVNRLVMSLLKDYEAAWKSIHPLSLKYIRSEINPASAAVAAQSETMIVQEFSMELDGTAHGVFIGLPYTALEPISERLFSAFFEEGAGRWRSYLEEKLLGSRVELSVELGNATITPAELLELQAGDIIQLGKKPEDPLDILAEGIPKFLGSPGASRGKQAVKVTGFIKKGDV